MLIMPPPHGACLIATLTWCHSKLCHSGLLSLPWICITLLYFWNFVPVFLSVLNSSTPAFSTKFSTNLLPPLSHYWLGYVFCVLLKYPIFLLPQTPSPFICELSFTIICIYVYVYMCVCIYIYIYIWCWPVIDVQ